MSTLSAAFRVSAHLAAISIWSLACVRVSLDPPCPPCLLVKPYLRYWGLKCPKSLFTCLAAEAHRMCGEGCSKIPIYTLLCWLPDSGLIPTQKWPGFIQESCPSPFGQKMTEAQLKVRRQRHRRNSSTFPSSIASLVLLFSFEHHSNYQQLTGVCDCALPLS